MGKIIRIKEGGLPKVFDAAKLRTNLQVGGNCLWIPKESVPVASKFITENGTYLAAAEGLHGYSMLSVNAVSTVTGKSRKNNNEYSVSTSKTGELSYNLLPTRIVIETLPTKTTYWDGESIDISGIVVKAYDENYNLWTNENYPNGIIPLEQLIIDPYKANKDSASGEVRVADDLGVEVKVNKDLFGTIDKYNRQIQRLNHQTRVSNEKIDKLENEVKGRKYKVVLLQDFLHPNKRTSQERVNIRMYLLSDKKNDNKTKIIGKEKRIGYGDYEDLWENEYIKVYEFGTRTDYIVTYDNKTVFYSGGYYAFDVRNPYFEGESIYEKIKQESTYPINIIGFDVTREEYNNTWQKMVWTAMYGDVKKGEQKISISWKRPQDDEQLNSEYSIEVNYEKTT